MARARNIKPGFFENEELSELPFEARLLFIGLWTLADKKGRLEHRPKRIKAQLFPYDSVQVEKLLEHLRHARFITLYEVEGQEYLQIDNFVKHQNPHKNEKDSEIPDPITNNDLDNNRDDSSNYASSTEKIGTTRADSLIPDSGFPPSDSSVLRTAADAAPDEIIWSAGVKLITGAGVSEPSARAFLGDLRKRHDDGELAAAVWQCMAAKPIDPRSWLKATLGERKRRVVV